MNNKRLHCMKTQEQIKNLRHSLKSLAVQDSDENAK